MTRSIARIATILVIALGALLANALPAAAVASSETTRAELQQRIAATLAEFPGGVQIAPNEISWEDGGIVLTLASAAAPAADAATAFAAGALHGCATGHYCAYSGQNFAGDRLTLSLCRATVSVTQMPVVGSIANARTTGTLLAKNAGFTTLTTVAASSSKATVPAGVTQITCVD